MKLTLAMAAFVLMAPAAFAQGVTGTTPGVTGTGAGTGATSGATVPGVNTAPAGTPLLPNNGIASPGGMRAPGATVNTTTQTNSSPNASAVQTSNTTARTSAAPVAGRNSFTQGEARRRIASAGFTNVSGLKKDGQGIWRGQAQKGGASVGVSLDYQGNVVGQ